MAYETHYFDAPAGVTFKIVLGRATYSIAAFDRDGDRIAWTGRNWGPALTDSLMMAAYYGEPLRASSGLRFCFGDSLNLVDLWEASVYRGAPACNRPRPVNLDRRKHWRIAGQCAQGPALEGVAARDANRRERILRELRISFAGFPNPHHMDSLPGIASRANAPESYLNPLFAEGLLYRTTNARGQPAFGFAGEAQ